jgi:hypothetical protein
LLLRFHHHRRRRHHNLPLMPQHAHRQPRMHLASSCTHARSYTRHRNPPRRRQGTMCLPRPALP